MSRASKEETTSGTVLDDHFPKEHGTTAKGIPPRDRDALAERVGFCKAAQGRTAARHAYEACPIR